MRIFSLWDLLLRANTRSCWRAPLFIQEGTDRGDLYQTVTIETGQWPICELIAGRPDAALYKVEESLNRWTPGNYNMQRAIAAYVRAWIYHRGEAAAARESIAREWPALKKNHYLRMNGINHWIYFNRAQSALVLAGDASDPRALLRSAERDARKLDVDPAPHVRAMARLIHAGCAATRGETQQAIDLLEKAAIEFDAADTAMLAIVARRRLGELKGGPGGRALVEESEAAMRAEAVAIPSG